MILNKPNINLNNYLVVDSEQAKKLGELGFIPIYREINKDKIYFNKNDEICEVIEKWNIETK